VGLSSQPAFPALFKGQTDTAAKAHFKLRPVRHLELHLADVMAAGGVMFVRHAGLIKLFSIPPEQK
jgi:hypothetical protein